jgi:erythrocyte band 7 integral membrane protein
MLTIIQLGYFNVQSNLDTATDFWGVRVVRIDIKNVRLPKSLQTAMSAEASATREARAKYIQAEGEKGASKKLAEAADIMGSEGLSLQLRMLQTLSGISVKNNNTYVVPFPIEMFDYERYE